MYLLKRIALFFLFIAVFIACNNPVKGRNGVVFKNPADYNDYIISRQTILIKNILDLGKKADSDVDSAYGMLDSYTNDATRIIAEIKDMPSYKGDSSLRDAAVNSFTFYKKLFGESYKRVLSIRREGGDETEEGAAEIMGIMDSIKREEEIHDKRLHNAQKDFASRFKMKMRDNEIQKEINQNQ
ncbi:MAG: hypothetical protein IPK57_07750 [Chitinophagaceae bacterium]|nr:hypothetical protein [Chitinophagaceae bacterium]